MSDFSEAMLLIAKDAEDIESLRKQVLRLQERLAAVPVAQLRRQYSIEPMTVHDFGLDAQDVDAWLRSLDGVGGHGDEAE